MCGFDEFSEEEKSDIFRFFFCIDFSVAEDYWRGIIVEMCGFQVFALVKNRTIFAFFFVFRILEAYQG